MNNYSQNFSLKDIFNSPELKGILPLINYKEKESENGKVSVRTNAKTINRQVFDISTSAARPFYKPLVTHRGGDTMVISGTLVGDHDSAVNAVYGALVSIRQLLTMTVNNMDMIRSALKESEKNKRTYGINSKLYLRVQSIAQIKGMNVRARQQLMSNIIENIIYGDDFPQTQKKFGVEKLPVNSPYNYEIRKQKWKQRVGDN